MMACQATLANILFQTHTRTHTHSTEAGGLKEAGGEGLPKVRTKTAVQQPTFSPSSEKQILQYTQTNTYVLQPNAHTSFVRLSEMRH